MWIVATGTASETTRARRPLQEAISTVQRARPIGHRDDDASGPRRRREREERARGAVMEAIRAGEPSGGSEPADRRDGRVALRARERPDPELPRPADPDLVLAGERLRAQRIP
jgi:hypothetical protein